MIFTLEIKIPKEAVLYRTYLDFPSKPSAQSFGMRMKKKIEKEDNYKNSIVIKKMSVGEVGKELKTNYFLNNIISKSYEINSKKRNESKRKVNSRVVVKNTSPTKTTEKDAIEKEFFARRGKVEGAISDIIHAVLYCDFSIKTAWILIKELKILLIKRHALKHDMVEPVFYNTRVLTRLFGDKIIYGSKLDLEKNKNIFTKIKNKIMGR